MDAILQHIASNGSSVGDLISGVFLIRTLEQAEKLSTMLAIHSPDPDRVAAGLWELMSNAIEHGNLGITCEEKATLLRKGIFRDEIERRLETAPYRDREVRVEFERGTGEIRYRIIDQGNGFDFETYLTAEFSLDLPNGRGIPIASRFSFDTMGYSGCGNCVEATVRL